MRLTRRLLIATVAKHERPTDGTYQDCPNTQEPEIGGNSGNSGNGQQLRGLQAFPPYKRSGNRWEHTHFFEYKSQSQTFLLVITVPTKKGVGTKNALSHQLEAAPFVAVHTVPTVPTLFGISGTFVLW